MACVAFVYESKIISSLLQALFPNFAMLFKTRSCDMYLLNSYVPLQLLKSLQVSFNLLLPIQNTCENFEGGALYWGTPCRPTKFRNKLLSFHYLKKTTAQNYERKH